MKYKMYSTPKREDIANWNVTKSMRRPIKKNKMFQLNGKTKRKKKQNDGFFRQSAAAAISPLVGWNFWSSYY